MKTADKTTRRRQRSARPSRARQRRGGSRPAERLFKVSWRPAESPRVEQVGARGERERRLEEVMLTTWAALNSGHPVECPVCSGPLTAAHGCRACGSHLS
jgi:hypothetical protein